MTTAVLLEGSVEGLSPENNDKDVEVVRSAGPKWSGHWRFAKDKKGFLSFEYEVILQAL